MSINAILKESLVSSVENLDTDHLPEEHDAQILMTEAKQNQANHSEAIQTALSTMDALDRSVSSLEALLIQNNEFAAISVESFYDSIGMSADTTPSVEQINELQHSLEAGVFDLIRKVSRGFTDSVAFIFKSYSSMSTDINKLKAKAKATTIVDGKRVTASNLHRLFVDGKVDPKSVMQGIENTELTAKRIFTEYTQHLELLYKNFSTAVVKVNDIWAMTAQGQRQNLVDITDAFATHGDNLKKAYGDLSHSANHQVEISGGMYFGTLTKANTELPGLWQKHASLLNSHVDAKQEVDAMPPKDIVKMCDHLLSIVDYIKTRISTILKELAKMYTSVFTAFESERSKNPGFFRTFIRCFRAYGLAAIYHYILSGILVTPINDISYHAFGVVRAAVGYGNRCLV